MRRSLAPSQISQRSSLPSLTVVEKKRANDETENGMITIRRLPLFDFLEIPEALSKTQFKVPSGCIVTEK